MNEEIEQQLSLWGAWMRQGAGAGIGYVSPMGTILRDSLGGGLPTAPITDADAMRIDAVVAALRVSDALQYQVLSLTYVRQMGGRAIGRALGMGETTVRRYHRLAVVWVADALLRRGVRPV